MAVAIIVCPNCNSQLKIKAQSPNKKVKCPACETIFRVREGKEAPLTPESPKVSLAPPPPEKGIGPSPFDEQRKIPTAQYRTVPKGQERLDPYRPPLPLEGDEAPTAKPEHVPLKKARLAPVWEPQPESPSKVEVPAELVPEAQEAKDEAEPTTGQNVSREVSKDQRSPPGPIAPYQEATPPVWEQECRPEEELGETGKEPPALPELREIGEPSPPPTEAQEAYPEPESDFEPPAPEGEAEPKREIEAVVEPPPWQTLPKKLGKVRIVVEEKTSDAAKVAPSRPAAAESAPGAAPGPPPSPEKRKKPPNDKKAPPVAPRPRTPVQALGTAVSGLLAHPLGVVLVVTAGFCALVVSAATMVFLPLLLAPLVVGMMTQLRRMTLERSGGGAREILGCFAAGRNALAQAVVGFAALTVLWGICLVPGIPAAYLGWWAANQVAPAGGLLFQAVLFLTLVVFGSLGTLSWIGAGLYAGHFAATLPDDEVAALRAFRCAWRDFAGRVWSLFLPAALGGLVSAIALGLLVILWREVSVLLALVILPLLLIGLMGVVLTLAVHAAAAIAGDPPSATAKRAG